VHEGEKEHRAVCPAAATSKVEDVDAAPLGGGVLAVCPAVATTEVEDVDDRPLGGARSRSGRAYH
jgi:hypothetical protein